MSKSLVVRFPDDTVWAIDLDFIARDRASYYARVDCKYNRTLVYDNVYQHELSVQDDSDLLDWASNNLNWSDVRDHAHLLYVDPAEIDYEKEWSNAEMSIPKETKSE